MRPELAHPEVSATAAEKMKSFQADVVAEVRAAIGAHKVVVVGMGWNPNVRRARAALDAAGIPFHYLGYGTYLSGWRKRLGIKLWSGWPTFPQVFVDSTLLGGADQTEAAIADGSLKQLVAAA